MIPTDEELIVLRRVGAALRVRRRCKGFKPDSAGAVSEIGETGWRRLESGYESGKVVVLLRGLSTLGVKLDMLATLIERATLNDLPPAEVQRAARTVESVGRPKKP